MALAANCTGKGADALSAATATGAHGIAVETNFSYVSIWLSAYISGRLAPIAMDAPQQEKPRKPRSARKPDAAEVPEPVQPREIGGRDGPEPTRFGDWEKSGRCIDF